MERDAQKAYNLQPENLPFLLLPEPRMNHSARRQIAIWLFICSAMVFAILVVGGVTRLTHSGLSIVEWQPIVGVVPPLNEKEWNETFDKYKKTPEYQQVNHHMTVDEFKGIFFWEYWHRVLGRLIGVAFFLPFLYFWRERRLNAGLDAEVARHLRSRWSAGGHGLVHGQERTG